MSDIPEAGAATFHHEPHPTLPRVVVPVPDDPDTLNTGAGADDDEFADAPDLCQECGVRRADYHGVDGWLCAPCDDLLHPRYEG